MKDSGGPGGRDTARNRRIWA